MGRGSSSFTRGIACALVASAALLVAPSARADSLDESELARLANGETVTRTSTMDRGDQRYVGGVTYTVLDSTPEEIERLLDDVSAYRQLLPRTKAATLVGNKNGDALVELRQGNDVFETAYTLRVHKDAAQRTVRFWLDPSRPHGIDDAWGFFRAEPLAQPGKVLLTYGILVDMGGGLARVFFEEKVRGLMLSVPQLVRAHIARIRAREPKRVTSN